MSTEVRDIESVSKWLRLGNFVIDQVIMLILVCILAFVAAFVLYASMGDEADAIFRKVENVPDIIFGAILFLIYYAPFEYFFGRTPAKWITGTHIVNESNERPKITKILARTVARIIPLEPFTIFRPDNRPFHDRISDTYVVKYRN